MKTRLGVLGVSAALVLAVAACGGPGEQGAETEDKPIKVGVILPNTGPNGPGGQKVVRGINLAVKKLNDNGGVLGRQIEVLTRDDEGTPAVAVSRAQDLLAEEVDVFFTGMISSVALAIQPVIARAGIMEITITAVSDELLSGKVNPDAVRVNASNNEGALAIGGYLSGLPDVKRIAVLQQNDAYGEGQLAAIEAALQGPEIVAVEKFDPKQTEFRVELGKVQAARPDAVLAINGAADSGGPALIKQYRELGLTAPLVFAATTLPPNAIELAGPAADGVVCAAVYLPDQPPFSEVPENNEFVKAYQAETNELPDHQAALGYLAVQVWAQAATKAGTLERSAVAAEIKGKTFEDTIFGPTTFADNGQNTAKLQLYRVENGKMVTF